jgi:uncharacterized protein (TIGR02145 family)
VKKQKRVTNLMLFALILTTTACSNATNEITSVKIGTQIWAAKNLDVSTFRNGDTITEAKTNEEWIKSGNEQKAAWCYYNNDPANGEKYGKLYNWYAVNDQRGLAPAGWHIPTDAEWKQLTDYTGEDNVNGIKMKSTNGRKDNGNGTNESGFTGLPGGYRSDDGRFNGVGKDGCWWSSTESDILNAFDRPLANDPGNDYGYIGNKGSGLSVRCLMDSEIKEESAQKTAVQVTVIKKHKMLEEVGEILLDGYIGDGYDILVSITRTSESKFEGKYLYKRQRKFIHLEGKVVGDSLFLTEWDEKGEKTGRFSAQLSKDYPTIRGFWERANGSGKLPFLLTKIIAVGVVPSSGVWEFAPDSLSAIVKKRTEKTEDGTKNTYENNIIYNLNGILTREIYEEVRGWSNVNYACINLKTGKRLEYDDLFKKELMGELIDLIVKKIKEACPGSVGSDFSAKDFNSNENFVFVSRNGISLIAPCQRQAGYFQGVFTVDFTFEEILPYLKAQ